MPSSLAKRRMKNAGAFTLGCSLATAAALFAPSAIAAETCPYFTADTIVATCKAGRERHMSYYIYPEFPAAGETYIQCGGENERFAYITAYKAGGKNPQWVTPGGSKTKIEGGYDKTSPIALACAAELDKAAKTLRLSNCFQMNRC